MDENLLGAYNYAINSGNVELFDVLAKDFDKLKNEDKNYLFESSVVNSPSVEFILHVMKLGFSKNYIVKNTGCTLLHLAALSEHPETIKYFISCGLDLEAKDSMDNTPLGTASMEAPNAEIVKALIEAGADVHTLVLKSENLLISSAGRNPNLEVTKFFIENGFELESRDSEGFTPLLNAARWQTNMDVLNFLIENCADMNAKTNNGDNLFHLAAQNKNSDIAYYLENHFMTSELNKEGESCLEMVLSSGSSPEVLEIFLRKMKVEHMFRASANKNPEIMQKLLTSGYDANSADSDGMTVLMAVARFNINPKVIIMLLYYNASLEMHDSFGHNLVHYAAANSDPTIYNWMQKEERFEKLFHEKDSEGHEPSFYREHPEKL